MNRLGRVVLGLATVPLVGGCVAAGYPSSSPMYSGYAVVQSRNVSIGINVPVYPSLVRIPGYPVYYAPGVATNYFFYDGVYWVFWNDGWYQSTWYNGPWVYVSPNVVPLFILRVPVRYYRYPPAFFRGWHQDAPPRWGEHWGPQWEQHRHGWDQWNRAAAPAPAPLPHYQREYSGAKYPGVDRQPVLRSEKYRYQPQEAAGRQLYQDREREREQMRVQPQQPAQRSYTPAPQQQRIQPMPQERNERQMEYQRSYPSAPVQQRAPTMQQPQTPAREQQRYQTQPQPQQLQQRYQTQPQPQPQQIQPRQDSSGRGQQPGAGQRSAPQGQGAAPRDNRQQDNRQQGQGRDNGRDDKQRQDRNP